MKNLITINTRTPGPVIERDVYGHFSEHLGRCIYGGLWVGPDSDIPNINGYRKDVVEALKKMGIPNLRWPGGCFADEYHWKDGIGPKEERKRMVNTHWGGVVEDNTFGTHEFMDLCELLDCKAYVCGNVGSGSIQEMQEWVEYITCPGDTPMARLRAKNGRKEPWKLPYFGVGNENWGCGGNMKPEYYADLYRRYQTYVRKYGPDKIFKIAGGPNVADYRWTEVLMREAGPLMDGLSLHNYCFEERWEDKKSATDFDRTGWFKTLRNAYRMDELIAEHSKIMDRYDPDKRVALVVDEWGCWHEAEPGTNPGFLYQQNTVRDALVAGITLNIFNNRADRVRIANLAQLANVLQSPILTEGAKMVLTPTWHVLEMYKGHQGAKLLSTAVCTDFYYEENGMVSGLAERGGLPIGTGIPALNASASVSDSGAYTVTLCNADPEEAKSVSLRFDGLASLPKTITARCLEGADMNSMNTFEDPDRVQARAFALPAAKGNELALELPARSVLAITLG